MYMSLQEIIVLIHNEEYGRAISSLEHEASDESRSPLERAEYCKWLAECNKRLDDYKASGDWYLEGVSRILSQQKELKTKAREALPMCEKALESYKEGGDSVDVLVAVKLRQNLMELAR
jgi:hypothetical protein